MNRREALAALISLPAAARIKAAALSVWPGQKVIVLDNGLRLKIVEQGKASA